MIALLFLAVPAAVIVVAAVIAMRNGLPEEGPNLPPEHLRMNLKNFTRQWIENDPNVDEEFRD